MGRNDPSYEVCAGCRGSGLGGLRGVWLRCGLGSDIGADGPGDKPGEREGREKANEARGDDGRAGGVAHDQGQDDGGAGEGGAGEDVHDQGEGEHGGLRWGESEGLYAGFGMWGLMWVKMDCFRPRFREKIKHTETDLTR